VVWGSGVGGLKTFQEESKAFFEGDGTPRFNPFFIPKMIADIVLILLKVRKFLLASFSNQYLMVRLKKFHR